MVALPHNDDYESDTVPFPSRKEFTSEGVTTEMYDAMAAVQRKHIQAVREENQRLQATHADARRCLLLVLSVLNETGGANDETDTWLARVAGGVEQALDYLGGANVVGIERIENVGPNRGTRFAVTLNGKRMAGWYHSKALAEQEAANLLLELLR